MGLDGKIYGSQTFTSFLAAINNPDVAGVGCNFTPNAVSLSGRIAQGGLPNFIQSNFIYADFDYIDTCYKSSTQFTVNFDNPDSVRWDFGDPTSGNNSSTDTITTHVFSGIGPYTVTLIVHYRALSDTVYKTINILPLPQVNFGIDTSICKGKFCPDETHQAEAADKACQRQYRDGFAMTQGPAQDALINPAGSLD